MVNVRMWEVTQQHVMQESISVQILNYLFVLIARLIQNVQVERLHSLLVL